MLQRILISSVGVLLGFAIMAPHVQAATSEAQLRVLPLECLFETVDDGSNQIVYLTPAACGSPETTTPNAQPPDAPGLPGSIQAPENTGNPQLAGNNPAEQPGSENSEQVANKNTFTRLGDFVRSGTAAASKPVYASIAVVVTGASLVGMAAFPILRERMMRMALEVIRFVLPW